MLKTPDLLRSFVSMHCEKDFSERYVRRTLGFIREHTEMKYTIGIMDAKDEEYLYARKGKAASKSLMSTRTLTILTTIRAVP